jgi:hypothetical protein
MGNNDKLVEIIFPTSMRLDVFSIREIMVNWWRLSSLPQLRMDLFTRR